MKSPSPDTSTPLRVLVVDDDRVHLRVAQSALENLGCTVDLAQSGAEAVAMAQTQIYDLIFMDISMPEMDGYEASRKIRNGSELNKKTPIVAASALERVAGKDSQLNDYLQKPLGIEDFRLALKVWTKFLRPRPQTEPEP
jgi:CheY-like chemotaxis protein